MLIKKYLPIIVYILMLTAVLSSFTVGRAEPSDDVGGLINIGQFQNPDVLPLTGEPSNDMDFYQKLLEAFENNNVTQPLTPILKKRFYDLSVQSGLDLQDVRMVAKGLATANPKVSSAGSVNNMITPENVKTMPLGASLWTDQSMFARRSVFDSGVLIGQSLVPNLQGITESGQSTTVSSRTDKSTTSSKFSLDFGVSVRYAGFHSSAGYKHDEASEKTKMAGGAAASIYNYATNTLRIEPEQASNYLEMRGALRGVALGEQEINSYVSLSSIRINPQDPNDTDTYDTVKVIRIYDGKLPPSELSPRAHIQALMRLEDIFSSLSAQFDKYKNNKAIQQQTLLDMLGLKKAINASIKAFYLNYGDSFVTEISGYSEVLGTGQLVQESSANNFERNNAGTLTGGYSNFIGGLETSASVSHWLKEASSYGASSVKTTVYQKPNNGVDLTGYSTSLNAWLNSAISSTGTMAQLPPVAITPSLPTLPTVRPWQDDPFAPPVKTKDFDDWKKSREAFKDSRGYKKPAWLKNIIEAAGVPAPENAADAQAAAAGVNNGDGVPIIEYVDVRDLPHRPMAERIVRSQINAQVEKLVVGQSGVKSIDYGNKEESYKLLYGQKLYNGIRHELRSLKSYGIKIKSQERQQNRQPGAWLASDGLNQAQVTTTALAEANEISLEKMMVSSFKGLPFSAVLVALRPNLEIPISVNLSTEGFINTSTLLATLNRYYTLDTYLNFIKSVPESGLGNTAIYDNFHKYVNHLEDLFMKLVETSMTSGDDITDEALATILNNEIAGLMPDGNSRDPVKTQLYKYLKSSDAYAYIYRLAEDPDYYRVIGKAPGGYIPFAPVPGGGYCFPRWSDIRRINDPGSTTVSGYNVRYLRASDCIEVTANSDISKLLGGSPQTPLFPLYIFVEGNNPPLLNFIQFIGGSRLIIGRDVTLAPPDGDVKSIPRVPWENPSMDIYKSMGYKSNLLADTSEFNRILRQLEAGDRYVDERTKDGYVNSFLPADVSWNYSIWFRGNDAASVEGFDKNQVLTARIGYYPNHNRRPLQGDSDDFTLTREGLYSSKSYSLSLTYQLLEPFSLQICVVKDCSEEIKNGLRFDNGLRRTYTLPEDNYLIGSFKPKDGGVKPVISKVSLKALGDAPGTKATGGLMLLYPITTDMLKGMGTGAFSYSSGSSPKDIFSQDDNGNSPFDAGFSRALLQR